MNLKLPVLVIASALAAGTATAAEPGAPARSSSFAIDITGYAPVVCRARIDATIVPGAPGRTSLGALNEFCNSPGGYQVFIDASPELANATLVVDGREVSLSGNGPTLVAASSGPAIESRQLAIDVPEGGVSGSLSVRIVAL
ncbi:MAG TPA: hypothetical protein VIT38_11465 [Allosphingosinicella sp.]